MHPKKTNNCHNPQSPETAHHLIKQPSHKLNENCRNPPPLGGVSIYQYTEKCHFPRKLFTTLFNRNADNTVTSSQKNTNGRIWGAQSYTARSKMATLAPYKFICKPRSRLLKRARPIKSDNQLRFVSKGVRKKLVRPGQG